MSKAIDVDAKAGEAVKGKSFLSGMKSGDVAATSSIGKNIHFKGEVVGAEDLYVEGSIQGIISMGGQNLSIGNDGYVSANIHAQNVLVNGSLEGDVFAEDLIEIRKSARVTGNLIAPRIKLEDGGKFKGTIDMVDSEQEKKERYDAFKDKLQYVQAESAFVPLKASDSALLPPASVELQLDELETEAVDLEQA